MTECEKRRALWDLVVSVVVGVMFGLGGVAIMIWLLP